MIFDYNPITGLNYYTDQLTIYDISLIPKCLEKLTPEELVKEWAILVRELGIPFVSKKDSPPIVIFNPIFSNVPYELFKKRLE